MNDTAKSAGEILIVDDNPVNLDLLSSMLREHQYRVRAATNGRRALTAVRSSAPELIMLDITMPEMDGYEVCRQLKADPLTHDIPVIFISALDEVLDKVRAFEVGGADYVTKPFQFGEVLVRIESQLKISRLQREMERKNQELQRSYADLEHANLQLERANRMLKSLSYLDALTGIANRRHFDETLDQEWRRACRTLTPLSLIMIDIDHFKRYNDSLGHQRGDDCLRQVATAISTALKRAGDLAARYGGEEFGVILPGTDCDGVALFGEELRARVEVMRLEHPGSPAKIVTISLGGATVYPTETMTTEGLITAADRALYQSKEAGRNRITVFSEELDSMKTPS